MASKMVQFIKKTYKITFFRKLYQYLLHLELPIDSIENINLIHPFNIIIHPDVKLGKNVTIYHNVTIGKYNGVPKIMDNVTIYPHSIIIGNIKIGKNSIIGAGSVVISDVPENTIVAGNPSKIIKKIK